MLNHVEIENNTEKHFLQYYNMGYGIIDSRHAFKPRDWFETYNYQRLGITKKVCRQYGSENGEVFCARIFAYLMYLIFLDIIVNNVTFKTPIGFGQESYIHVKGYDKDYILKHPTRFAYLDPIGSEWIGYQFVYNFPIHLGRKEKTLYIYGKLSKLFYTYVNNGRKYY